MGESLNKKENMVGGREIEEGMGEIPETEENGNYGRSERDKELN